MSRRVVSFLAVLSAIACLILIPAAHAGEVSHARIVRLSYALGDVQMSADGAAGWHKAIANTPVREGNSLATGDGRAEVEFETGAMAWVASNTVLEFPQLILEDGAKNTQLAVKQGTATFYVQPGRHDSFAVEAGPLWIVTTESARFRVDVFDDGAAVSVLRGAVSVTGNGVTQHLNGHSTLALRSEAQGSGVVSANPRSDAWDRWVSDRFTSVDEARLNSTDNLKAPFGYGMADLSFYGGWVMVPGYGLGWQPFGVGAGWSPFFNGYWDSFGLLGGPTWISYDPWGWLPYHYGGWVFSPIYGWVWAPGSAGFAVWSPATVFWMTTPSGIGWVARAPGETLKGTAQNLAQGVVTNTSAGMLAGSRNSILRGADAAKVQMIGEWKGEGELSRIVQQAQGRQASQATTKAALNIRSAQRMPANGALRIASAGMFAGHVQVYEPPIPPGHLGHNAAARENQGSAALPTGTPTGTRSEGAAGRPQSATGDAGKVKP
ncbi:MAG TPA: FecR family protein [Candidatus Acidoferrales bacterium]|nr:FecR family protein [Candidatus Acidoferrales bacterium]